MNFDELEVVYDLIAEAIDEAGSDNTPLLLSKLALLLAHEIGDLQTVKRAVEAAKQDLSG
ncbi:MAG: DUF2783 domain-containing protein [Gammaproteobacteria bacterium]|nr:DUF2783 domain-containing protein [Gammaproteobacteria bacterium]